MANNRLELCEVSKDGKCIKSITIGKHFGEGWHFSYYNESSYEFIARLEEFMFNAWLNGNGISLKDEYMDIPLPPLFLYNDEYEGEGKWVFVKEENHE